jgi:hypothetical protein
MLQRLVKGLVNVVLVSKLIFKHIFKEIHLKDMNKASLKNNDHYLNIKSCKT